LRSEDVIPEHVIEVAHSIQACGYWTDPIRVEWSTNIVMDGHHRLAAAVSLSLAYVPCAEYSYSEVDVTSRREEHVVNPASIRSRALAANPYPSKTTKHTFPDSPLTRVPIENLRNSPLVDSDVESADSISIAETLAPVNA
jgi:hypothetical protein